MHTKAVGLIHLFAIVNHLHLPFAFDGRSNAFLLHADALHGQLIAPHLDYGMEESRPISLFRGVVTQTEQQSPLAVGFETDNNDLVGH